MKRPLLPKGVHAKHGAYYLVRQVDKKRRWVRLSAIADGTPALYRALAEVETAGATDDRIPAVITAWLKEVGTKHSKKTQANDATEVV